MSEAIMKKPEAVSENKFSVFVRSAMAGGGLTLGMMLMLAAVLVWATSAIENREHDRLELIFIAAGFVFLGIGAHGLDLVHEAKREATMRRLDL